MKTNDTKIGGLVRIPPQTILDNSSLEWEGDSILGSWRSGGHKINAVLVDTDGRLAYLWHDEERYGPSPMIPAIENDGVSFRTLAEAVAAVERRCTAMARTRANCGQCRYRCTSMRRV